MSTEPKTVFMKYFPTWGPRRVNIDDIEINAEPSAGTRLARIMFDKELITAEEYLVVVNPHGDYMVYTESDAAIYGTAP